MTAETMNFVDVKSVHYEGHDIKQVVHNTDQIWPPAMLILPSNPQVGETNYWEESKTTVPVKFNRHGFRVDIDASLVDSARWAGFDLCVLLYRHGNAEQMQYVLDGHSTTLVSASIGMPPDTPAVVLSFPFDPYLSFTGRNVHKGDIIRIAYCSHGQGFFGPVTVVNGAFVDILVI